MESKEIWMDCYGYEGLYQVSNMGRLWSVRTQRTFTGSVGKDGYVKTTLTAVNGKKKTEKVHRLVALSFLGKPEDPNKTQVNHKDENKTNNCLDNLEWMTPFENVNYGTRNKRAGEKHRRMVSQFTMDGKWIATYHSLTDAAAQTGIGHGNISLAASGKRNMAAGYKWRYGDAEGRFADK